EQTKLRIAITLESFGDVRHDRDRSSSNLIPKGIISEKLLFTSHLIHRAIQLPSFLPRLDVLKPLNRTHGREFLTWNLELGTWNLEPGTWNLELGTWNLELGTWNLEPGTFQAATAFAADLMS